MSIDLDKKLLFSIQENDQDKIAELIKQGAHINAKDENGSTPLMLAIKHRFSDTAELLLLKYKPNIDETDDQNNSPLMLAVATRCEDIVSLLLIMGAHVDIKNKNNRSALDIAFIELNNLENPTWSDQAFYSHIIMELLCYGTPFDQNLAHKIPAAKEILDYNNNTSPDALIQAITHDGDNHFYLKYDWLEYALAKNDREKILHAIHKGLFKTDDIMETLLNAWSKPFYFDILSDILQYMEIEHIKKWLITAKECNNKKMFHIIDEYLKQT